MQNWTDRFKKSGQVKPGVVPKVEQFVVNNIDHPISVIYLRSLGKQGTTGRIRVKKLTEQGMGIKMGYMNKIIGVK